MSQNHTNKKSTAATNVAPKLFPSHSATSVDNLPILTQYIIISNPQTLMYSSSLKVKLNLSIPMTASFSLLISDAQVKNYFPPSSLLVGFVHLFVLMCRRYTSNHSTFLILAFNSSGRKFPFLIPQSTFALYTALLTQTIMNFFSTTIPNLLKQSLYNLHALKSLSLVISASIALTGLPFPQIFPTLLVSMLRRFPLSMN